MPITLLHVFSTFATGGPQVRFAALAKQLGEKYRHIIVALDGNYDCAEKLDASVNFELRRIKVNKGATWGSIRRFRALLGEWRPDLLLTYNWGAIEWALANFRGAVPQIHIEDGFGPEEAGGRQLPRRVWTRRVALMMGKHVIVPSHTLFEIATKIWRLPERKITLIPNGVDCGLFENVCGEQAPPPFSVPDDGLVIGTIGALRAEKNLPRLVRAFAALDRNADMYLVIVGDGPVVPAIIEQAKQLGVAERVLLPGHVAVPATVYGKFDIFALSSDTEQMPLSVLEAMAAGLPIASLDVGDVARMVPPENSPFVRGRDETALSHSLSQLCADTGLRASIGHANARHVQAHYSLDRMCEAYDRQFMAAIRAE